MPRSAKPRAPRDTTLSDRSWRTFKRSLLNHYVLNGHKIWTSFAHIADYCFVLARTDATAQRHKGISFFLVDMKAPGVRVEPIRQITGEADFNEVVFENVRVPADALVGEENGGWRLAMAAASFERGTYFIPRLVRFSQEVAALQRLAAGTPRADGASALQDPHLRLGAVDPAVPECASAHARRT